MPDHSGPPSPQGEAFTRLTAYWRARCLDGRPPGKHLIDPVDLPDLLSRLILWEAIEGRGGAVVDYRVRLAGSDCERHFGYSLKGQRMSHLLSRVTPAGPAWDRFALALREGRPDMRSAVLSGCEGSLAFDRLILPLSDDTGRARFLLGLYRFHPPQPETGLRAASGGPARETLASRPHGD